MATVDAQPVHLLETTLRDGSYEINFQFTLEDTAFLAAALDRAGFKYLEVSHGNGVGTARWRKPFRAIRPAHEDEAHIATALSVMENAQLVTFMVAGTAFAPMTELDRLHDLGVRIVRLGFEPQDLSAPETLAYIDHAKKLGFTVAVNLMQTYFVPVDVVAAGSKEVAKRGGDWFCVVDSAGGMNPAEVREYVGAIKAASGLVVGLHAHNNSGLAVANSLAGIEAGATMVDATLQGIGRATGNPPTEQMVLALQKLGHEQQIDRDLVMKLGDLARSLFAEKGNDPTHFVSGAARLHSRNVAPTLKQAAERGVPGREFIHHMGLGLAARGRVVPNEASLGEISNAIKIEAKKVALVPRAHELVGQGVSRTAAASLAQCCEDLYIRSNKRRKRSVLCLIPASQSFFSAALPWENGALVGVALPWEKGRSAADLAADRIPEVVLYDASVADDALLAKLKGAQLLAYPFASLIADAAADLVAKVSGGEPIASLGKSQLGEMIAQRLRERGLNVNASEPGQSTKVLIAASLDAETLGRLGARQVVVLHGPRSAAERDAVGKARARGAMVLRPLVATQLAARTEAMLGLEQRMASPLEAEQVYGLRVVDPMIVPIADEVVVDSFLSPSTILDAPAELAVSAAVDLGRRRVESWLAGKGQI